VRPAATAVGDEAPVSVVGTIGVGGDPAGVAVDPVAGIVYVTNRASDSVSIVDERALRAVATVPVGHAPAGVAADPFGVALDATLAYDTACRVNPPLASRHDALALLQGIVDGTIDAIATDHAPHPPEHKAVEFAAAAPGMIGLETALSLGLAAVEAGRLGLGRLLEALSARPAALVSETRTLAAGSPADLVVFDPAARWRVDAAALASASANTPLLGMELPGVVRMTVADGRITYRDGLEPIG
jgi:YVTN family beta-propeller protein